MKHIQTHSPIFFLLKIQPSIPLPSPFSLIWLYTTTLIFFPPSLVLLTYFCLIHNHIYDGIGNTVTLEVTQLITILYSYAHCHLIGKIIQTMLRRKIQRSVFKSQQLTDSLNLVYELILRDHTKFPTSLDLINHHMYLFNKCAHSNHGHICGNLSHSSKRILCLSDCSRSIHIQFMFQFSLVLVMSDSLRPHAPKHARPPCPSPTPRVYSNSCPLSR